jgi:hypothetical protein
MKRSLALNLLVILAAPTVAVAQDAATTSDAQKIIARQIAAFERDDAVEAYSYASPGIQALFPDPDVFLSMVAANYAAVHRHRSVEFGPAAEQDGRIAETVIFTDGDGQVWNAFYKLERQPEGGWKISGCVLAKSDQKGL